MKDQAEALRKKLLQKEQKSLTAKTLAVVSGKGGVGKSNFSLNFSISLSKKGYKVLLFDMDVGMGNIDILLGNSSQFSIVDFFDEKESLKNIVAEGPSGLHYIAGGTGLNRLFKLDEQLMNKFTEELSELFDYYEYVIFDMGAGVSEESLHFILSVDEIILVTTPEPTSVTDAYSMLKHIHMLDEKVPFLIVVNRALSEEDGVQTYNRLKLVARKFLDREVKPLGMIPDDRAIQLAVKKQIPFVLNEKSAASKAILKIVDLYEKHIFKELQPGRNFHFVSKLKQFLFER